MIHRSFPRNFIPRHVTSIVFAAAFPFAIAPSAASAYTLKTLHAFCTEQNPPCGDGTNPYAGLLMDQAGNLYGTAEYGGKYGAGLVFKLIPNGDGTYKEYVLHNFCARAHCADGEYPEAELILDADGNLYGTATEGGKCCGVVFKLTHGANGWSLKVLHTFCPTGNGCTDGYNPETRLAYAGQASGAPWDEFSPLFGTTEYGGANSGGVVFKLTVDGSLWNYEVIHNFNSMDDDAAEPGGPLLVDSSGNLFGVTQFVGKYGRGVLYRLTADTWKETTLHNFCAETNCADGARGVGRLAMDAAGNIFGTTAYGGSGSDCTYSDGCGVVFERPAGGGYHIVYNFCSLPNCSDGWNPQGGLVPDGSGNLFGTTTHGGANSQKGVAFELAPSGLESILWNFCPKGEPCKTGATPTAPPILDGQGDLFGTTFDGGANGDFGTVFELTP